MPRIPEPTTDERKELARSLIGQLTMTHQMTMKCNRDNHQHAGMRLLPTSMQGVVLKHGIGRWGARLPSGYRKLANRLCFQHATDLAVADSRFIYCEGYACRADLGLAMQHAWVLDEHDNFRVLDNTWENPLLGCYLGIPFSTKFLRKSLLRRRCYGIIDDWQTGYPILSAAPSEYLHELAGEIPRVFEIPAFDDYGIWDQVGEGLVA